MKNSVRVQCEFSCFGETGNDTLHHILLVYMTCSSVHVLFVCLFGCVYKRASAFLCSDMPLQYHINRFAGQTLMPR